MLIHKVIHGSYLFMCELPCFFHMIPCSASRIIGFKLHTEYTDTLLLYAAFFIALGLV